MRGAIAPGEAWLLGLYDYDSVAFGSPKLGLCVGPVRGFSLIVFRKAISANTGNHYIAVCGSDAEHIWTYDSWIDSFVSVPLQGLTPRILSRAIVRMYGVDAIEGNEYVVENVSKTNVSFRLP